MDDIANIPLERTPREGFLRTGLADKAKEAKGCETGRAGGVEGAKSWRQVNASGTMIGDERPSPPLHNQHIVNWAHQRTNPGNEAWKHCVPPRFCPLLISAGALLQPCWDYCNKVFQVLIIHLISNLITHLTMLVHNQSIFKFKLL